MFKCLNLLQACPEESKLADLYITVIIITNSFEHEWCEVQGAQ